MLDSVYMETKTIIEYRIMLNMKQKEFYQKCSMILVV